MLPFVDRDAGCALPGASCIAHCFYNYAGITRPVRVGGCNCKGLFTRERTPKLPVTPEIAWVLVVQSERAS